MLHDPVGVRVPAGVGPVANAPHHRLTDDVARPHHARVDPALLQLALEVDPPEPGLGADHERVGEPRRLQTLELARHLEQLGEPAEELGVPGEVALPHLVVVRELRELDESERGAELRRLEVPAQLLEDEEAVVLHPVDLGEEALVALPGAVELELAAAAPPAQQQAAVAEFGRRRAAASRRCPPR